MALLGSDPILKLQDLLASDWRIDALLRDLTFAVDDTAYLRGGPPAADVPVLFESLMSARDRERHARAAARAAAAEAVTRATQRRTLSRPRWRWEDAGFSAAVVGRPEFLIAGRALLRAVARAVVWVIRLRLAAVARARALAPAAAADDRARVALFAAAAVPWLAAATRRAADAVWDAGLVLDVGAPPTAAELDAAAADAARAARAPRPPAGALGALARGLGCARPPGGPGAEPLVFGVARARAAALRARVKGVLDAVAGALALPPGRGGPPPGLAACWGRLTADGFFFPPFYLTGAERRAVSLDVVGATRWMRPLRLRAPDLAADPGLLAKLRPDPPLVPAASPHPQPPGPRATPVAAAYRYADEAGGEGGARAAATRRHSISALGPVRLRSWAGEDRGRAVYGSAAAGEFRRVETVALCAVVLRGLVAGVLLPLRPSAARVEEMRAPGGEGLPAALARGRANARVLASAVYALLGRTLPGLLAGSYPAEALAGGWAAHAAGERAERDAAAGVGEGGGAGSGAGADAGAGGPPGGSGAGGSTAPATAAATYSLDGVHVIVAASSGGAPAPPASPVGLPGYLHSPPTSPVAAAAGDDDGGGGGSVGSQSQTPYTFGKGSGAAVAAAVRASQHAAALATETAALRLAAVAPSAPGAVPPSPFERWLASQVLPAAYFEGGAPSGHGRAGVPAAAVRAAAAATGWLDAEEARLRVFAAWLGRYCLTTGSHVAGGGPRARGPGDGGAREWMADASGEGGDAADLMDAALSWDKAMAPPVTGAGGWTA